MCRTKANLKNTTFITRPKQRVENNHFKPSHSSPKYTTKKIPHLKSLKPLALPCQFPSCLLVSIVSRESHARTPCLFTKMKQKSKVLLLVEYHFALLLPKYAIQYLLLYCKLSPNSIALSLS